MKIPKRTWDMTFAHLLNTPLGLVEKDPFFERRVECACLELSPSGFICTLKPHHKGKHIAESVTKEIKAKW